MFRGGAEPVEDEVEAFITRWRVSEGAERAAYAQFLSELCRLIGVERPLPPTSDTDAVTYRFEYPVRFPDGQGGHTTGRIDLYKKGAFVLEAKQSRLKGRPKALLLAEHEQGAKGSPPACGAGEALKSDVTSSCSTPAIRASATPRPFRPPMAGRPS